MLRDLTYNVHYEIAALVFLIVMYCYMRIQYNAGTVTSRKFRRLVIMVTMTDALDVATAIEICYASHIPWIINMLSNTLYFMALIYMLYLYIDYVETFMRRKLHRINTIINQGLFVAYILLMLVNMFTGWVFGFSDAGEYIHGPLYYSIYILSFYYLLDGFVVSMINKSKMNSRQRASVILFCIMEITGSMVQIFLFPNVLLNIFCASVAIVVIMFALETPDYMRLTVAMEQLKVVAENLDIARKEAEDARQEAESANKAKSAFLAAMSHEIRTPINGVLGMNSIIMKETEDPKILEYSRNIESAGNGLLSLVNDILDFSKIESGKMEIVPVDYKLSDVLSDCYNMVFIRAKEKGVDMFFENNPTIPNNLHGDEARVRQIIVNLLTNGIKYTEEGMVLLTADYEIGDNLDEVILVISVKDTGIGIKKKNLDKLFEAFSRVDQERNRNIEGTGLGLKITKQFLDMMGGEISVDSVYGAGSEFVVRIPQKVQSGKQIGNFADYAHLSTEEIPVIDNGFKCPKGRILVVDDVEINLKVIRGLLKDTKLKVDTALSGKECLEKIQTETYDVIMLDHMMPHMDGIETLQKMRELSNVFNPNIPVIMLTANAIQGAKEEYLSVGFTDYLAKPVREDELNEILVKYLPKELVILNSDLAKAPKSNDNFKVINIIDNYPKEIDFNALELSNDKIFPKTELEKRFFFLDVKTGLSYCMQSEEFYESIVKEFRNTNKYEEIQMMYDEADMYNYAILVHGVKSSALTIGAGDISEMAKALEFAANSDDTEYIRENHYIFMRKYGELLDNLDEVYGG